MKNLLISLIKYNFINLPQQISHQDGHWAEYTPSLGVGSGLRRVKSKALL